MTCKDGGHNEGCVILNSKKNFLNLLYNFQLSIFRLRGQLSSILPIFLAIRKDFPFLRAVKEVWFRVMIPSLGILDSNAFAYQYTKLIAQMTCNKILCKLLCIDHMSKTLQNNLYREKQISYDLTSMWFLKMPQSCKWKVDSTGCWALGG